MEFIAFVHLRHAEDHLRPAAPGAVSASETARRTIGRESLMAMTVHQHHGVA
jgi:hypothetical protein